MSTEIEKKKITLSTFDGETFKIEEAVALKSQTIRHLIEDDCADNVIPLPNVTSKTLTKVIEYCSKHVEEESKNDEDRDAASLKEWDASYINVDQNELYHLLLAANYLNINGLLDLACQTAADMIKGKQPEEIRNIFNIKNDLPPEQEEEVRRENQWAF